VIFGTLYSSARDEPLSEEELQHLNNQSIEKSRLGEYGAAISSAKKFLQGVKERFGEHSLQYAIALHNLAHSLKASGQFVKLKSIFICALIFSIDLKRKIALNWPLL